MSGGNPFPPALAVDGPSGDPREQLGITLDADTVLCENHDCKFIGLPMNGRCRKCAGHSLTRLDEVLNGERSALAQKGETNA